MTLLAVDDLEMRFGERLIQTGITFEVARGTIFAIMGGSGCGKSTLLKHLVGLLPPAQGHVRYNGVDYWAADEAGQAKLRLAGLRFMTRHMSWKAWSLSSLASKTRFQSEARERSSGKRERYCSTASSGR